MLQLLPGISPYEHGSSSGRWEVIRRDTIIIIITLNKSGHKLSSVINTSFDKLSDIQKDNIQYAVAAFKIYFRGTNMRWFDSLCDSR